MTVRFKFNKGFIMALLASLVIWSFILLTIDSCRAQRVVKTDSVVIVVDSTKWVDVYYNKSGALLDSVEYNEPIYHIFARRITVEGDSIIPDTVFVRLGEIKANAVIFDLSILGKGKWSFGYRAISNKKNVQSSGMIWSLTEDDKLSYIIYDPPDPVMIRKIRTGGVIGVGVYKKKIGENDE